MARDENVSWFEDLAGHMMDHIISSILASMLLVLVGHPEIETDGR